ncbi:hypothetical protein GCK32_019935 [Trichostrongylus colubriformis]|uniref:Uncharacterized protein n=1 Tax=Trichostrongylus colubriformis TaxID=6319 RepID=A0AAN8F2Z0_TRICO
MKNILSVLLLFLAFTQTTLAYDTLQEMSKREIRPSWEDLGWAWGKRSASERLVYPRRYLRAMELVKKNPDWHDLGWTWGRRK